MNPWIRFAIVQLVNLPLMVVGWFVCLSPLLQELTWLWDNWDDVLLIDRMSWWQRYVYTAWRNPVSNLRHVPGVSLVGGPLAYRSWLWRGKQFYYKVGYSPHTGYPMMSAGAGRGY